MHCGFKITARLTAHRVRTETRGRDGHVAHWGPSPRVIYNKTHLSQRNCRACITPLAFSQRLGFRRDITVTAEGRGPVGPGFPRNPAAQAAAAPTEWQSQPGGGGGGNSGSGGQ